MPRNFMCPETGDFCGEQNCTVARCLISVRDQIARSLADKERLERAKKAEEDAWFEELFRQHGLIK